MAAERWDTYYGNFLNHSAVILDIELVLNIYTLGVQPIIWSVPLFQVPCGEGMNYISQFAVTQVQMGSPASQRRGEETGDRYTNQEH